MRLRVALLALAFCGDVASATTASPPAPAIVLEGRVVNRQGVAVAGAEVRLHAVETAYSRASRLLEGGRLAVLASSTSGQDGGYRLVAPSAGGLWLRVTAKGYLPTALPLGPVVESQTVPDVYLAEGGTIRLDAAMALTIADAAGSGTFRSRLEAQRGSGHLDLAVPRAGEARFHVGTPGSMPAECVVVSGRTCPLASQVGRPLRLVVERKHKPLVGAIVALAGSGWPLGRTAEDGSLLVTVPTAGRLGLEVVAEDGGRADFVVVDVGERPEPPVRRVEVDAPARVVVTVLAAENRAPLPAALVVTHNGEVGRTDPTGRVEVQATGEAVAAVAGRLNGVARGAREPVSVTLAPAAGVVARVVDEVGKPRVGVRVVAEGSSASRRWECRNRPLWARTDGAGRAQLRRLDASCDWTLLVHHPGLVPVAAPVPALGSGAAPVVELVVPRGAIGVVAVTDEAGTPIAGAEVTVTPIRAGESTNARSATDPPPSETTTDLDGVARVAGLGVGSYSLEVGAAGFAPLVVPGVAVEATDEQVDFGTVVLGPEAFVVVEVVDTEGQPIPRARGWAGTDRQLWERFAGDGDNPPDPDGVSGSDGLLRLGGLSPASRSHVVVDAEGFSRESTVAVAGADPVRITLTPAVRVAGRVIDEGGAPVAGAAVSLSLTSRNEGLPLGRVHLKALSADDGSFAFEVAGSSAHLTAGLAGYQRAGHELRELAPAVVLEAIELRLLPDAMVEGVVRGPDGGVPLGAAVSQISSGRRTGVSVRADGGYRIEGLTPGNALLEATAEGLAPQRREVELEVGANTVDFTLSRGATIRGTVTADGAPLAGATVSLGGRNAGFGERGTTDAAGRFELASLRGGEHTLLAQARGFAQGESVRVEVAEGGEAEVTIDLESGVRLTGSIHGLDLAALGRCRVGASLSRGAWVDGVVDFEGRYVIEGLTPGTWTVAASADGRSSRGEVEVTTVGATLDLEFPRGVAVAGKVVVNGEPGAGFQVSIGPRSGGVVVFATTDANGSFRLEGVASGTSELVVHRMGGALRSKEALEVGDQDLLDVVVELGSAAVEGRVVDLTGKPVAEATVRVLDAVSGSAWSASSAADGRFTASPVQAGNSTLVVQAKGYAAQRRDANLVVGETLRADFELAPEADFTFAVDGAVGRAQVRVAFVDSTGAAVLTANPLVGDQGRVRVESAPPGAFEVVVADWTWGNRPAITFAAVVPGEGPRVVLTAARAVTVRLVDARTPANLVVRDSSGRVARFFGRRQSVQDFVEVPSGLTIVELPTGAWTLEARGEDGRVWAGEVVVGSAPVQAQLEVQLEAQLEAQE